MELWDSELSEQEREDLITKAAREIKKRKLQVPAILLFEMHKPLSYIGSQAAVVFSPFLVPFLGFDNVNNYSRLLADRNSLEQLLEQLESEDDAPEKTEG